MRTDLPFKVGDKVWWFKSVRSAGCHTKHAGVIVDMPKAGSDRYKVELSEDSTTRHLDYGSLDFRKDDQCGAV